MVVAAGAPVLAVLTRAPSAGGKSRLWAGLGRSADPDLLAALLLDTIDRLRQCRAPAHLVVAVDPPGACAEVEALVGPTVEVIGQAAGSLGDRMRALFEDRLTAGAASVVLVGSDLPDLPPGRVDEAFTLIAHDPDVLVLGPAGDGGYYLVGSGHTPEVFGDVAWGGATVLSQTLARAAGLGLRVRALAPWADVDTPADLRRVAGGRDAPRTRTWVRTRWPAGTEGA